MPVNVGQAIGYLDLDTSGFRTGFSSALKDLQTFQNQSATMGDKLGSLGSAFSSTGSTLTKAFTLPIAGAATAVVKTTSDFDSAMSQVQATMGITKDYMTEVNGEEVNAIEALRQVAKEQGAATKFSATEAAEGLNYMALAGYDVQTSVEMLPTVLKLAASGAMELGAASDAVTDIQSALGLSIDETTELVDKMAKTASSSNTSVSQLGDAMLTVGGTARQLKGGTTELSTALGILANNGIKGSEGGTALRNVILSLAAPTDKAAETLSSFGYDIQQLTYDSEGAMRPLEDIFTELNDITGTMTQAEKNQLFSAMFNKRDLKSVEALLAGTKVNLAGITKELKASGVAAEEMVANTELGLAGLVDEILYNLEQGTSLEDIQEYLHFEYDLDMGDAADVIAAVSASLEDNASDWADLTGKINEAKGAAGEMADTQLDNLEGQLTILKSGLEGLAISFGELIMPLVRDAVTFIQKIVDKLNSLDNSQRTLILTIAGIAAAVGPVLIVAGKIISAIGIISNMIAGAGGLTGILSALTGPIGLIIAAAAALVAAWVTDFGDIQEKTQEVLTAINTIVDSVLTIVKGIWDNNLFEIRTVVTDVMNTIEKVFSDVLDIIVDVFNIFADLFSGNWDKLWEDVKKLVEDIWTGIKDFVSGALNAIVDFIIGIAVDLFGAIGYAFGKVEEGAREIWENITNWFKEAVKDPVGIINSIGEALYNAGKSIFTSLWDGIKSIWTNISNWVAEKVNWIADKVQFWKTKSNEMNSQPAQDMYNSDLYTAKNTPTESERSYGTQNRSSSETKEQPVVINMTYELDGEVLARNQFAYNESESDRQGRPLVR